MQYMPVHPFGFFYPGQSGGPSVATFPHFDENHPYGPYPEQYAPYYPHAPTYTRKPVEKRSRILRRKRGVLRQIKQVDLLPRPLSPLLGRRRALVIGINYEHSPSLRLQGCVHDAERQYGWLLHIGFHPTQVTIMTDHTPGKPVKSNIVRAIKWLVSGARAGDSLFFHFSGHGISNIRDRSGDESDGFDEGILTLDGIIVDDRLHRLLADSIPRGCRLTALMDCCHSGTALDLPFVFQPQVGGLQLTEPQPLDAGEIVCFSAASDQQLSSDQIVEDRSVGILTEAFQRTVATPVHQSLGQVFGNIATVVQTEGQPLNGGFPQTVQLSTSHNFDLNSPFTL